MIRLLAIVLGCAAMAGAIVRWIFPWPLRAYAAEARALVATARRSWGAEPFVHRAALAIIAALALFFRVVHLRQPIRYDEAWSFLNFSSRPLSIALSDYRLPNNHVFHTLLAWMSTRAFGDAAWAIRLPALVAGTLLVPVTYLAARRLGNAQGALIAMGIAAVLPSLILYSTNARGYVLLCLAFLAQLLLADALADEDTPRLWVPFALVTALGAYTAPVMMYPAGTAILWLLLERRRRGRVSAVRTIPHLVGALALAGVLTVMLYAPVIVRTGAASLVSNRFVKAHGWPQFLADLRAFGSVVYDTLGLGLPIALAVLIAVGALASLVRDDDGRRSARLTLAASVVVWCAVLLVATRRPPPGRVLMYVAGIVCIYAGIGLASLVRLVVRSTNAQRTVVAAAAVLLTVGVGTWETARRVVDRSDETDWIGLRDAPEVARFLLAELRPTDRLVLTEVGPPLDYYLFTLANRRVREFTANANPSRLLVIVNESHHQTFEYVLNRRTVAWDEFSAPRVLREFGGSRVYEVHALVTPESRATLPTLPRP